MNDIAFEKIDGSRSARLDAGYVMSALALLGGVLLFFTASATGAFVAGGVLLAMAVLGYVQLLRKAPKLHYFRYFWLDKDGVHHIEGNSPAGRTAHFAWHEIDSAEASASGDDFRGPVLTLKRRGMQGVPVLLTMENAQAAAAAIREAMDSGQYRERSAG